MLVKMCGGRKCKIKVKRFADDVDAGKRCPAPLKGLTLPTDTRFHALVGKQFVFNDVVALLHLVARLNIAGKEGTLVTVLDGTALCGLLHRCLAGTRLLLCPDTLALQASGLLLGSKQIRVQNFICAQGDIDRLTDTALVLGKLFAIVHQAGNRNGFLVFRIINHVIVKLFLRDIAVKLRQDLGQLPFGKQLNIITDNAMIKLRVLQSKQAVHITDIFIGGHLCELIAQYREARFVIPLDIFPKGQTILKVLVFKDRVGADDGRTDKVSAHLLRKG